MDFIEEYKKYDILLKFCLAGEISVGKTLFKERIALDRNPKNSEYYNKYLKKYHPTFCADFDIFSIKFKNKIIKIQLYDSSGDSSFENIKSWYFIGCNAFLIMYDYLNRYSFEKGKKIYDELIQQYNNSIFCLIRCKYDLPLNKKNIDDYVSDEEALEFASKNNIIFAHISNKEKYETGIKELFTIIFNEIALNKGK